MKEITSRLTAADQQLTTYASIPDIKIMRLQFAVSSTANAKGDRVAVCTPTAATYASLKVERDKFFAAEGELDAD
jgi:hypothetical protein